jgi:hypothetical protein
MQSVPVEPWNPWFPCCLPDDQSVPSSLYANRTHRADERVPPIRGRMGRVRHEAKSGKATSRFMGASGNATAVVPVGRRASLRRGTMLEGLRKPTDLIVVVVTLLASGCPLQAIVHAYGLDERTVASWRDRAGRHS